MTITTTYRKAGPFQGDGSTTEFPFDFKVYDAEHLKVILTSSAGVESELVLDADYSVSLNEDQETNPGGFITYPYHDPEGSSPPPPPLAVDEKLTIITDQPATQEATLNNMGGFFPKTIEKRLDWLTILVQQLEEKVNRSLRGAVSDDFDMSLGSGAQRANKFLYFDSLGRPSAVPGTPVEPDVIELDVRSFGARGDWKSGSGTGTDNLAALNAAFNSASALALLSGRAVKIKFPAGKFRISDEWNVWRPASPRADLIIEGDDQLGTQLVLDFYGADKAGIRCVDPNETARSSPTSIRNMGFRNVSTEGGVNPVFIYILGHGESRLERLRFSGTNNSFMRLYGEQNLRADDIVAFNVGREFPYKDTTGITFDVSGTTSTITASAPIFEPGDVGKRFSILPSDPLRRIQYTIASYVSPTQVTVSGSALNTTGASALFEAARCSMSAGSTTLVANADVFTPDMVGLVLYVRAGRTGANGKGLLRAKIASYISPTTVELDTAATEEVVNEHFGVAALDMGQHPSMVGSSDVKITKLHIESYSGVAFVAQNVDSYHITSSKIHGVATSATSSKKATAAAWLDDYSGYFNCDLDSSCSFSDARVYWCNSNQLTVWDQLFTRSIRNGVLFRSDVVTDQHGYLLVRGLSSAVSSGSVIVDANADADPTDPRILVYGIDHRISDDGRKARFALGGTTFLTPDGKLVFGGPSVYGDLPVHIAGATAARQRFETIGLRKWTIGSSGSHFTIRDETAGVDVFRMVPGDQGVTNADISTGITWDGTPPSGASALKYTWRRIGNVVFFAMRLEYNTPGTDNQTLAVTLPAGMPAPLSFTGAGTGEIAYPVTGFISSSNTAASNIALPASLTNDGSGVWTVYVRASATLAARLAGISGFYFTS